MTAFQRLQANMQYDTHLLHSYNHTAPSLGEPAYYHQNKRYLQSHDQAIPWIYPPNQTKPSTQLLHPNNAADTAAEGKAAVGTPYPADGPGSHAAASNGPSRHDPSFPYSSARRRRACSRGRPTIHTPLSATSTPNPQKDQHHRRRMPKTHHPITTNIPLNPKMLSQRRALQHHGNPVQEHRARQAEEPAVGVAGVDLLRVVGRVDVQALRGAAVQAGRAAPGAPLFCTRWLVR